MGVPLAQLACDLLSSKDVNLRQAEILTCDALTRRPKTALLARAANRPFAALGKQA
jgi:hypothetical protein